MGPALFGFAVVIAAAIPPIAQSDDGTDTIVGLFWLAALVTMWAVFGELLTLWMLLGELTVEDGVSAAVFKVLLAAAALSIAIQRRPPDHPNHEGVCRAAWRCHA
jgi:hypothetical protein